LKLFFVAFIQLIKSEKKKGSPISGGNGTKEIGGKRPLL
jgi:hypothetical protein